MIVGTVLVALSLAVQQPPADSLISADSAMAELRKGGYIMVWRHGATDRSVAEPMEINTERFQQRNLTDRGVADSKAVGAIFKARGIVVGDVIASPMYRTLETAQYAFGRATPSLLLRTLSPSPEERALILVQPAPGTNRLLVTHHFIIERNAPGIKPGDVGEGEAVVLKSNGTALKTVAIIKMADWTRLTPQPTTQAAPAAPAFAHPLPGGAAHGGYGPPNNAPLVIPPSLQTPKTVAVADFLKVFNTGDSTRMRQYFERSMVPNPARSIADLLGLFEHVKGALGTLSIISVDAADLAGIVVRARGSLGSGATLTFKMEEAAPYRVASIGMGYLR